VRRAAKRKTLRVIMRDILTFALQPDGLSG